MTAAELRANAARGTATRTFRTVHFITGNREYKRRLWYNHTNKTHYVIFYGNAVECNIYPAEYQTLPYTIAKLAL